MADIKISGLSAGTAPDGTEVLPAVQGGSTISLTVDQIAVYTTTPLIDATHQTTDATASVVVATYTPAHKTVIHVESEFIAREHSGTDGKIRTVNAGFITDNSGVVTLMGSVSGGDTHNTSGAASWTASLTTDGSVVNFTVTGAAATTIDWRVIGDVQVLAG